jgi:hypothetical protein
MHTYFITQGKNDKMLKERFTNKSNWKNEPS